MRITAYIPLVVLVAGLSVGSSVRAQTPQANMHAPAGDADYIQMMAMHHDEGIKMAETATKKATDSGVKRLAIRIVEVQRKERQELDALRAKASGAPAQAMKPMAMDHLNTTTGREFDRMFLSMMSEHHQGAVKMSREAELSAAAVKAFAQRTITKQGKEIKEMATLLKRLK